MITASNESLLRTMGEDFRRARKERGFSREILAELAGVHVNTVAAAERGEKDLNSLTETKLFAVLGCDGIAVEPDGFRIRLSAAPAAYPRGDILAVPDPRVVRFMADAVRSRRQGLGLSLGELADLAGLHRNSVWNFERGLVSPGGLTLYKIYRTLGIGFVSASPAGVEFR
jgi:transcriptional regulator with XRE-family HTH domain